MPEVVYSVEAREKKSVDVQVCLGEGKKDTDQSRDYSIQVDQVDFFVPLYSLKPSQSCKTKIWMESLGSS